MKRTIITIIMALCCLSVLAQEEKHLVERVYIATDKDVYVAGESIHCSAFCVDVNGNSLSEFSSIAYIELHSTEGMVQTAKVALQGGRGAAEIEIPMTVPTGNYAILAYTAQNCNEVGYDFRTNLRMVSIYNTFTSARVPDGVEVVDALPADAKHTNTSSISIRSGRASSGKLPLCIKNTSSENVSLSISVYHDDGIYCPVATDITNFRVGAKPQSFVDARVPEYDGEIVRGRVVGFSQDNADKLLSKFAFISVPGDLTGTYSSAIGEDGQVTFFTNNLYGNNDLVCQIENDDTGCHIELESPFVDAKVGSIPALKMNSSISESLLQRSVALQIGKWFDSDTLYDYMSVRRDLLFKDEPKIYHLDDYTRLPLMEECITEFIDEVRARKVGGKRDLQVNLQNSVRGNSFERGVSLMMVDGIPIFDQETIYRYDPLLVKDVVIYPYTYFIGSRSYGGIVDFQTYKKNFQGLTFPESVRIVDFKGASYPMAMTGSSIDSKYPDYRQTIYWHPIMSIDASDEESIDCVLPAYKGKFKVVVEGISESGKLIYEEASFNVE